MKQAADWMIQKRRGKCVCVHGTSVLTIILAEEDDKENGERNEEVNLDGLTPAMLEVRYARIIHFLLSHSHPRWFVIFFVAK